MSQMILDILLRTSFGKKNFLLISKTLLSQIIYLFTYSYLSIIHLFTFNVTSSSLEGP